MEDKEFYKVHEFGVKSANYPTLKNAGELATPLIYLMREKDYVKNLAYELKDYITGTLLQ